MRTAIIDLDPIVHIVANNHFKEENRTDVEAVRNGVRTFINSILSTANCDRYVMFFQDIGHENFRNALVPQYKEHRTRNEAIEIWKPAIVETFKEYGAFGLKHIESDDALAIYANKIKLNNKVTFDSFDDYVIVENDKDLKCIPGQHYNPYKNIPTEERWVKYTDDQAYHYKMLQLLTGDGTDVGAEFCGIYGIGMVKAQKMLQNVDPVNYKDFIQGVYIEKFGPFMGPIRFIQTYCIVGLITGVKKFYPETELVWNLESTEYTKPADNMFSNESTVNGKNLFNI